MPGQSRDALATEILIVTAGGTAYTVWSLLRTERRELPPLSADQAGRWFGMAATWLLSIGAGISLLAGSGGGLYLLAFAVLLGIVLEVPAAWSLVVWVGKNARGRDISSGQEQTAERPRARQLAAEEDRRRAEPGR
jgi:hypothetical protein